MSSKNSKWFCLESHIAEAKSIHLIRILSLVCQHNWAENNMPKTNKTLSDKITNAREMVQVAKLKIETLSKNQRSAKALIKRHSDSTTTQSMYQSEVSKRSKLLRKIFIELSASKKELTSLVKKERESKRRPKKESNEKSAAIELMDAYFSSVTKSGVLTDNDVAEIKKLMINKIKAA